MSLNGNPNTPHPQWDLSEGNIPYYIRQWVVRRTDRVEYESNLDWHKAVVEGIHRVNNSEMLLACAELEYDVYLFKKTLPDARHLLLELFPDKVKNVGYWISVRLGPGLGTALRIQYQSVMYLIQGFENEWSAEDKARAYGYLEPFNKKREDMVYSLGEGRW